MIYSFSIRRQQIQIIKLKRTDPEAYLKPYQTSRMEFFAKIVEDF